MDGWAVIVEMACTLLMKNLESQDNAVLFCAASFIQMASPNTLWLVALNNIALNCRDK